jgi:uncharacterized protein YraI
MRHARWISLHPLLVLMALVGVALACTAQIDTGGSANNGSGSGSGTRGENSVSTVPIVRILEPVSGVSVPANQRVDITVETDTPATSFLLNVSGRVASSKALPSGQAGPTKAILSWMPTQQGTFSLEVIAFNGAAASVPASLMVQVSGTASAASSGASSTCTGRVLVSQLNFRDGPGTGYTQLGQFDVGETVTVVGRDADTSWYKVQRTNMQQVWAINTAQWMQTDGDCSGVPVVG